MKKIIVLASCAALTASIILFTGYYKTSWAEDNKIIVFIKKKPTLQIKFVNYFSTDSEDKSNVHQLDRKDRRLVVDYCKYHLGIEIEMNTQEEMDTCEAAYHATRKKPSIYEHEAVQ
ncbi:hypothetical protein [Pseudomonas folii]|uniref:hypothetical protein n=1 Tax=Pseudomonas folii TaxID=2762593 RepID=UPI001BE42A9C|nr:hypothetical protein [Pseudomonas folii]